MGDIQYSIFKSEIHNHNNAVERKKMISTVRSFQRLFLLFLVACTLFATSIIVNGYLNSGRDKYVAAVVEYAPLEWDGFEKPKDLFLRNANRFVTIIERAAKENADIIVFPECGLTTLNIPVKREGITEYTTFIPNPVEKRTPCTDNDTGLAEHLRVLSCAAKNNKMYVAVNMDEKITCESDMQGCPKDHLIFFNTNIVFDRNGTIIAKYRKFNLFKEPEFNSTIFPIYAVFKTDFGATFGMFICFDILFAQPAEVIVSKYKVTDILYSTAWFSELPFLTAVQTQAGYSYSMNVNLLASGYNRPDLYSGGSGIYAGEDGPVVTTMPAFRTTRLLVGELTIYGTGRKRPVCEYADSCPLSKGKVIDIHFNDTHDKEGMLFLKDDLSKYSTEFIEETTSYEHAMIQHLGDDKETNLEYSRNGFNCSITVTWFRDDTSSNNKGPVYRLVAHSGIRSFAGVRSAYIEVCALVACADRTIESCGHRPSFENVSSRTQVKNVNIHTESLNITTPFVSTLDSNIYPLMGNELSFIESIDKFRGYIQKTYLFLEKPKDDLITFGVYKL
ncbi:vanin-like protein 1 isoform X1 [Nilaparvata lugens]|uniref:vanin-like protein 1 isoform X1 n=1 Tax=Nilaparvata lugens TaxID=108931 RepID=UPI00193DF02B|nr:vanin-like protein 1 isoform X1 [Nilaparvata lugens]